jgi:hypothetical protein
MPDSSAGLQHYIGASRITTDIIFRDLHARCMSAGGHLSLSELENARRRFLANFPSGFDLFILSTLLRACSERSARHAFARQAEHFGPTWIGWFYDGLAQYVRDRASVSADRRLIKAYVAAATRHGHDLSFRHLLIDGEVQNVMRECVTIFGAPNAPETVVCDLGNFINSFTAERGHIGGPHLSKITDRQTQLFLTLLPCETHTVLKSHMSA